jgi:parvulin-like peptidyl-prolyl isomerase
MKTKLVLAAVLGIMSFVIPGAAAVESGELVLIEVNGQPITGSDLDHMIMDSHTSGMTDVRAQGLVPRLLERAMHDMLILQDAFAMGMGEDPAITDPIEEQATRKAISLYSRSRVTQPQISDAELEEYFNDYYHKLKLRQVSLATREECLAATEQIESGEISMGTLAVKRSLDTLKPRGGLHNDKYWSDVELQLRDLSVGLEAGEISEPFPYGDVWSFIRVESRTPPNPVEITRFEGYIRSVLRNQKFKQAWAALVAEHEGRVDVQVRAEAIDAIRSDEEILFRGEFKNGSATPALVIDEDHLVTEGRLRDTTSHTAMQMGASPFEEIFEKALAIETEQLVLAWFAEQEGWFESPEVVEFYEAELERVVLNAYLDVSVGSEISITREEYESYYRDHGDEFRGAEEVRLSILNSADEQVIESVAARLREGADFDFLRAETDGRDANTSSDVSSWSPISVFNGSIRSEIEALAVGQTSNPIDFGQGWMIVRLDGRRQGAIPPIEEMDATIREALYTEKFSAGLNALMVRLRDASEIVRHEDNIRAWAQSES